MPSIAYFQIGTEPKRSGVVYSAYLYYRFGDGSLLHIEQEPGWCWQCEQLVAVEKLRSKQQLNEEIEALKTPTQIQLFAFDGEKGVRKRIEELHRRIQWREHRQSSPRCLFCSIHLIEPIPERGSCRHPETGQKIAFITEEFADSALWIAVYTPEGELLEEKPTLESLLGRG